MSEVVAFPRADQKIVRDDFGQLIELYLETRDTQSAIERRHKAHVKQYREVMKRIEAKLFEHLQTHNVQSLSSDLGTAYISHKRSAAIGDADAFKSYVIENRAWEMIDWKANVTAVGDFLTEHEILPPGINYRVEQSINIMKK